MTTQDAARPMSRKRQETRQRLVGAALAVFAERGFGATSVEQVCERAGFTRGAFYSNFASLDELFLTAWGDHSGRMLAEMERLLGEETRPEVGSVREAVGHVLGAVPVDDEWYRLTAEFTAHALRNPSLKRVMAAREQAILDALLPVMRSLLARIDRRITDEVALGHALVAVHDGTTVQCLIEDDPAAARAAQERRTDLFALLVEHYTEETR